MHGGGIEQILEDVEVLGPALALHQPEPAAGRSGMQRSAVALMNASVLAHRTRFPDPTSSARQELNPYGAVLRRLGGRR